MLYMSKVLESRDAGNEWQIYLLMRILRLRCLRAFFIANIYRMRQDISLAYIQCHSLLRCLYLFDNQKERSKIENVLALINAIA